MIDVRRLRVIRELADRGSVVGAARALSLTPSAVSQQIAALERETGTTLVERHGRGVRLTPTGELLVARAHAVFAELEQLDADLAAHLAGEAGALRLGAFATAMGQLVAPVVARLARERPQLTVALVALDPHVALEHLAAGDLDLAVAYAAEGAGRSDDPRIETLPLFTEDYDVALPAGEARADGRPVDLRRLSGSAWVTTSPGTPCRARVERACHDAGFDPRPVAVSDDYSVLLALVAAGLGVALVPRLGQRTLPPGVALATIAGPPVRREVFVAVRRGSAGRPGIAAVVDALRVAAEEAGRAP